MNSIHHRWILKKPKKKTAKVKIQSFEDEIIRIRLKDDPFQALMTPLLLRGREKTKNRNRGHLDQ